MSTPQAIADLDEEALDVLDFIIDFKIEHNGVSPSKTEICNECGVSMYKLRMLLAKLERAGRIYIMPDIGRRNIGVCDSRYVPPLDRVDF